MTAPGGRSPGAGGWRSVPAEIAARAAETPEAIAIRCQGHCYTYRQLAISAAGISVALADARIAVGDHVAVCGPRGAALVATWIAVLARRAVLVPVDPLLSATRHRQVLAKADHLVLAGSMPDTSPQLSADLPVVEIADDLRAYAAPAALLATADPPPDEPGYLLLTSGTTGRPKAIVGRHRSLAHFLHWQRTTFTVGAPDRIAHLASVEFDPSLREVFLPLTSGATLCLPPEQPLPADQVVAWLADEQVSLTHAVPTLARAWLRTAPAGLRLPQLRLLMFNGEALSDTLVQRWRHRLGYHGDIVNLYGPAETTLARCWHRISDPPPPGIQPLGRPIADTIVWTATSGKPAEAGQTGEIIIHTPYASSGYLDATPAEQARFQVDDTDPTTTIFHTGDLGHLDHEGILHFDGRIDDQIKIYGVRVQLSGIEAVLESQPGIDRATVTADPTPGDAAPRLTAHLVLQPDQHGVPPTLRADLRERLPTAAIPARFVVVVELPALSASGKTDRRALHSPGLSHRPRDTTMTITSPSDLSTIASGMRAWVLAANKHPGGGSSAVEAVTALYFSGATAASVPDGFADRIIYSKGHAAAPWYFALWAIGELPGPTWRDLAGFGELGHRLPRMPARDASRGMHMSTGALGQGLSFGVGTALADHRQGRDTRTFVVLGDGECTEGQVWEAAMTAARLELRNLVALIDANGSGSVITLPREQWAHRWRGFGWQVHEVDGHDPVGIAALLSDARNATGPTALILNTVKGKGLRPPAEGSNSISAQADPDMLPDLDTAALVDDALAVIDRLHPWADTARQRTADPAPAHAPAVVPDRADILARMAGHPVGTAPVAKKSLGAELATELADLGMLWMAPDAIRNSGLLDRMNTTASWDWSRPHADVLQCAIAEQDAASLAAGAASAGLHPVLFSMEGFYWRMLDQIRQSIAFSGLPVMLVGTSGGLGDLLGPMVQSDGCLTALSAIAGLDIYEAADINTAKLLAAQILANNRPAYLRLPHEQVTVRHELSDLAAMPLDDGVVTLRACDDPQVVIVAAGAMREAAIEVADLLASQRQRDVRVLEVVALSRFADLPTSRRERLLPSTALIASIHNAPRSVLGNLLPVGAISLGVDTYGIAGSPVTALYDAAGLTAAALYDAIVKELP